MQYDTDDPVRGVLQMAHGNKVKEVLIGNITMAPGIERYGANLGLEAVTFHLHSGCFTD